MCIYDLTWLVKVAAKRFAVAKHYALAKCEKYCKKPNISGLCLEVLGGMSEEMHGLFQIMAANLEMRIRFLKMRGQTDCLTDHLTTDCSSLRMLD